MPFNFFTYFVVKKVLILLFQQHPYRVQKFKPRKIKFSDDILISKSKRKVNWNKILKNAKYFNNNNSADPT